MKSKALYFLLVLFPAMFTMCGRGKVKTFAIGIQAEQACYLATDAKDTAYLYIESPDGRKAEGTLEIRYWKNRILKGNFKGSFSGDTLVVRYAFASTKVQSGFHLNPLVFLIKKDSLILGDVPVLVHLGRGYIDRRHPVDFARGRFHFHIIDCAYRKPGSQSLAGR